MNQVESGGCLCGEYTYEFPREAVLTAFHCHCRDCQKSTGTGRASVVLVPTEAVATRGNLKNFTVTGTNGAHVARGFCPHCGSQVMSQIEELPAVRLIKAGTLEDSSWLEINSSCWSCTAVPWSPVDQTGVIFERNPDL
ncbi:GFA family protein [Microbulbifer sp. SA54]|uniref:GFA family protein n=1 Tax=Microbulbifer sp. SA54 TaxID=3401577 RepID=UPI003AB0C387